MSKRNKAVFLDRDGVINHLIYNPDTSQHESPHHPNDFTPIPSAAEALRMLADNHFILIVVSNQPSWAKGKTTHEKLVEIDKKLLEWCEQENIALTERYYCHHHPEAVIPELKLTCECRKPGTLFLQHAQSGYNISMKDSWFVGDRTTDILCGQKSGCRTILVKSEEPVKMEIANADFGADNLLEAAKIIIRETE